MQQSETPVSKSSSHRNRNSEDYNLAYLFMILTVSFTVVDGEGLGCCRLVFLLVFHIYLEFLAKLIPKYFIFLLAL